MPEPVPVPERRAARAGGHGHGHGLGATGTLDGRYLIRSELGRGGMGAVFLAQDLILGQQVAVKFVLGLAGGGYPSEERCVALLKEAMRTAQLEHPHIVRVYDVGTWRDSPFWVMEYLRGRPLSDVVGAGLELAQAIEAMHPSLIHSWERLAHWLDESRDERVFVAEVAQAAALWEQRGRRDEEVWHGEALQEARRMQERCSLRLPEQAVRFLAAGEGRRQRLVRRRRAFTVLGGALLAAVALGSLAVAWALAAKEREAQAGRQQAEQQRTIAEERRREAEQRTSEALREGTRAALARRDYVEARARLRSSLELQDSLLGRALWWTLRQEPVVARRMLNGNAYDAAYSADGRTLAVACQDRSVYLLDAATLDVRQVLGCSDQVRSAALSPDGRWLGAGLVSGNVWLWDLARPGQPRVLEARHGHYGRMAFTPDSNQLAFSNTDGTVRLWDLARPEQVSLLQAPGMPELTGLALDATGRRLAAAGFDGAVWLWEAPWGEAPPQRLDGHRDRVLAVAFDRRGELLASGSFD